MSKSLFNVSGSKIETPPMSTDARREVGFLLRMLQEGVSLGMPESRPMPSIGTRVHELRINDSAENKTWRIVYRIDTDAILIVDVFAKKTQQTAKATIDRCKRRLKAYDVC
ncbi:MAG: type II toxin-antitoxin system RelE/ParE family toxin [Acidobacteria bacterium]|nr:type II toxin-antitoxin system RelE/ParE family toxin [Acidobacteriota bacterium]